MNKICIKSFCIHQHTKLIFRFFSLCYKHGIILDIFQWFHRHLTQIAKSKIYSHNYIVTHCCYFSSQFKHFVPFCRYYVSSGNRAFPFNFRRLSFSFLQDQISSVCQKTFFFLSHSTSLLCEQSFYTCNPSIKIYLVFWITIFLLLFWYTNW